MRAILRWATGVAAAATVSVTATVGQTGPDFQTEYERLLLTYGQYKSYPEKTAAGIEGRLEPDRANTLKAIVRAGLSDLDPGGPLISQVEAVRGIWGVRPNNAEGKHQFRVSIRLKEGARKVLDGAQFVRSASGAHVLMPQPKGGDDEANFAGFQVNSDARTWRQVADEPPRLQISQLRSDERTGEIDIDFHEVVCHFNPSNSDPGALKDQSHSHWDLVNTHYVFPPNLGIKCQNVDSHCDNAYHQPYCR